MFVYRKYFSSTFEVICLRLGSSRHLETGSDIRKKIFLLEGKLKQSVFAITKRIVVYSSTEENISAKPKSIKP